MTRKQQNKEVGALGERIAVKYLTDRDFSVLETNYWKKWGEIDVIATKHSVIHFIEVKTVSHETKANLQHSVTHETWRPEELVHRFKLRQIHKALEMWIIEHNYSGEWQIDVLAVRIVPRETYASVKFIENIVLN